MITTAVVEQALERRCQLWQPIEGFEQLEESTGLTLQKVRAVKCVKRLRSVLEDTNELTVSVAYNQGTGDIAFTVKKIPVLSAGKPTPPLSETERLRRCVVLGMLAMLPSEEQRLVDPNTCLRLFSDTTTLTIIDRRYNKSRGSVTIVFKPKKDCQGPSRSTFSNKTAKFQEISYSPRYLDLEEGDAVAARSVALEMVEEVWREVRSLHYIPAPQLVEAVSGRLEAFFASGVCGIVNKFRSALDQQVGLYLIGVPGIGKSSFVTCFSLAVERVLRKHLDTNQAVSVVKVPLNANSPDVLKKQAIVKGLSDHSIERMIEQGICQGQVVLLHLEENPEDQEAQLVLNEIVNLVQAKLDKRYPHLRSNIIVVCTANHDMNPALGTRYSHVIPLTPPEPEDRRKWMCEQLEQVARCSVRLEAYPDTSDMRSLGQWCLTLGHHLKRIGVSDEALVDKDSSGRWIVKAKDQRVLCHLSTSPGSFFCYKEAETAELTQQAQILTVLDMVGTGSLEPGVIVLKKANADLIEFIKATAEKQLHPTTNVSLSVLTEEDRTKVFGAPPDIRGGLFRIIDDCTGPNQQSQKHLVIDVTVSEEGQFILRELLESGNSRTHRLKIRKRGCIFVLTLADCSMTPQLLSRAHLIF